MTDSVLRSLLEESFEREWASYANAPEFKTSKKHDRVMNRIFKRYEKNTRKLYSQSTTTVRNLSRRIMIAVLVVILAVLAGCAATYFISQSFRGEVYSDNTELFPINLEGCPTTIEQKYCLPDIPEGYEVLQTSSTPFSTHISYINEQTGQTISFSQYVKGSFDSIHYNTEKGELVEVEINGHYGLFLDISDEENICSCVIWDNEDYILELYGNLAKNEILDLAYYAKVL
ncbi:MAG: DUF4367 domain-containing protein [Oscillospiraceae bacterium]|nr:DUF4367 domain-containing protein [Oscillospiraceae bacterium]